MMIGDRYFAIVVSPEGRIWENTSAFAKGNNAENNARQWAKQKFIGELLGHFFKTGLSHLEYSIWSVAHNNGWRCECFPVLDESKGEIQYKTSARELRTKRQEAAE